MLATSVRASTRLATSVHEHVLQRTEAHPVLFEAHGARNSALITQMFDSQVVAEPLLGLSFSQCFACCQGSSFKTSGPSADMNIQIRHGVGCRLVRAMTSDEARVTDVTDGTRILLSPCPHSAGLHFGQRCPTFRILQLGSPVPRANQSVECEPIIQHEREALTT